MSIINGLLTGGVLIGKICQAMTGAGESVIDEETGALLSGATHVGDIAFFRKQEPDGTSAVYVANRSVDSSASVCIPNEDGSEGTGYDLAPMGTSKFIEASEPTVSPNITVTTGLDEFTDGVGNVRQTLYRMAFKGLKIGSLVNVRGFTISCTTTQLAIITPAITLTAISYMYLNSDKGVNATTTSRIPADTPPTPPPSDTKSNVNDPINVTFTIDFEKLGIDPTNDVFEGCLSFETTSSFEERVAVSGTKSVPLTAAEKKFLKIA